MQLFEICSKTMKSGKNSGDFTGQFSGGVTNKSPKSRTFFMQLQILNFFLLQGVQAVFLGGTAPRSVKIRRNQEKCRIIKKAMFWRSIGLLVTFWSLLGRNLVKKWSFLALFGCFWSLFDGDPSLGIRNHFSWSLKRSNQKLSENTSKNAYFGQFFDR